MVVLVPPAERLLLQKLLRLSLIRGNLRLADFSSKLSELFKQSAGVQGIALNKLCKQQIVDGLRFLQYDEKYYGS